MEFDLVRTLRRPSFEHAKRERGERADRFGLFGVFDDFGAGVVFLFHVSKVSQMRQKASIFFHFFSGVNPSPFLKKFKRLF